MLPPRVKEVDAFLRSGECICPFARSCVIHYAQVSIVPIFDRKRMIPVIDQFAGSLGATPPHALVIVAAADEDHEHMSLWATAMFAEFDLMLAARTLPGEQAKLPEEQAKLSVELRLRRRALIDPSIPVRPRLALDGHSLEAICMSPHYPSGHPRYSPHTIFVLTWISDIKGAQESTKLLGDIRNAMMTHHGYVYDASELVLHLPGTTPPRPTRRRLKERRRKKR